MSVYNTEISEVRKTIRELAEMQRTAGIEIKEHQRIYSNHEPQTPGWWEVYCERHTNPQRHAAHLKSSSMQYEQVVRRDKIRGLLYDLAELKARRHNDWLDIHFFKKSYKSSGYKRIS